MKILIRPMLPTDEAFIYSTWSKNTWHGGAKRNVPKESKREWFKAKFAEIKAAISEGQIKVACFDEDPYMVFGYVVIRHGKVMWSYIKRDYRNEGIEALFNEKGNA